MVRIGQRIVQGNFVLRTHLRVGNFKSPRKNFSSENQSQNQAWRKSERDNFTLDAPNSRSKKINFSILLILFKEGNLVQVRNEDSTIVPDFTGIVSKPTDLIREQGVEYLNIEITLTTSIWIKIYEVLHLKIL